MTENSDISVWLEDLKKGDDRAAMAIWDFYFPQIVRLAKRRLASLPSGDRDEEDVALSAMKSFLLRAREDKFPSLTDRDELRKLLMTILVRKVMARQEYLFAKKRPDLRVRQPTVTDGNADHSSAEASLGEVPSEEVVTDFFDDLERRLEELPDDDLREVVRLKLDGYTNKEIAERFDTYEVKIERQLRKIRKIWSEEPPQ